MTILSRPRGVLAGSCLVLAFMAGARLDAQPVTLVDFGEGWRFRGFSTDVGTVWREEGFDDSSWPAVALPLGVNKVGEVPEPIRTSWSATEIQPVYYFRKQFHFDGDPAGLELDIVLEIEDGAVVHLNGQELVRVGMGLGEVMWVTPAAREVTDAVLESFTLPAGLLRDGPNLLAVEVHPADESSSDIVCGVRLEVTPPRPLEFATQPRSQEVVEFDPIEFEASLTRGIGSFQWYRVRDNTTSLVEGAHDATFSIPFAGMGDGGSYFVEASNAVGVVRSVAAGVVVTPRVGPLQLVTAVGDPDPGEITVSFSRPLSEATATNVSAYVITNTQGGLLTVIGARVTDATNVVLTTVPRVGANYLLWVGDVADAAAVPNSMAPDSLTPIRTRLRLIPLDATWDYFDPVFGFHSGELSGDEWKSELDLDFSGVEGDRGAAPFVSDLRGLELPVTANTVLSQTRYLTANFRAVFDFPGTVAGVTLGLRHLVDDGAVFYLNGEEIDRYNLPEGPIATNTSARARIWAASFVTNTVSSDALRPGRNVLAAELHQIQRLDWDKVFAVELEAVVDSFPVGPPLILEQPRDVEVEEGATAVFRVGWIGGGCVQWYRDGVAVLDATNRDYRLEGVVPSMTGASFHAAIGEPGWTPAISAGATLRVVADRTPPELIDALAVGERVTLRFSEPIDAVGAADAGNYLVTNCLSGWRAIESVTFIGPDTVVLVVRDRLELGDFVVAAHLRDRAEIPVAMSIPSGRRIGFDRVIWPWNGIWRFDDSGADLGVGWREPGFDDSGWKSGPGPLGREDALLEEPIRTAVELADNTITYYFRARLAGAALPLGVPVVLRHMIDDGAVLYLNGVEIGRVRIDAGQDYSTFAATVVDADVEGPFSIPVEAWGEGGNVLAVEVHQTSLRSSDLAMGAELSLSSGPSVRMAPPSGLLFPELSIVPLRDVVRVRVGWPELDGSFVLQRALDPAGPWVSFPSLITAPPNRQRDFPVSGAPRTFFRLLGPEQACWTPEE